MAGGISPGLILGCVAAGAAGLAVGKKTPQISLRLIEYKEGRRGEAYHSYLFPEWRSWIYAFGLAVIWAAAVYWYSLAQLAVTAVLSTAAMVIIYMDNRYRIIANEITFPLMICGMVLNLAGGGIEGFLGSLLSAAIGIALCLAAAALTRKSGAVGAGDVKLMTAVALVSGYPGFVNALFFVAVSMGIYCAAGLLMRRMTLQSYFPMGGFIAAGMVFAIFEKELMPWVFLLLERK